MKVVIIGAGKVGGAIARGLSGRGHAVTLGVRDPASATVTTLSSAVGAEVASLASAAKAADIVILALPWRAASEAVAALGDLAGKAVIDCMNPLGMVDGALGLTLGHTASGGETVQGWLPHAHVVKTLNQVGAGIMADNADLPARPVMFMAGNDDGAKHNVGRLLRDLGFAQLDTGDITMARLLEPFGMLWINQAMARGMGRDWAFAAIERPGQSHE